MVVFADQSFADDGVQSLNTVVPDCLAALAGTHGACLAVTAQFLVGFGGVGVGPHALEVLFDHGSLLARYAKSFPQESLGTNDEVCQEAREEHAADSLVPDLALLGQCLRRSELEHVFANAKQLTKPLNKLKSVSGATGGIETFSLRRECGRAGM